VRRPNFIKLGRDIVLSYVLNKCVSEFRYLAAFQTRGFYSTDVKNEAKFRTLLVVCIN